MKIRKEQEKDFEKVYNLNKQAFNQENESKLIEKIRIGENFIPELSLVAEKDNEIIGHILFSKIIIRGNNVHQSLALAPMSVKPHLQKQGIGGKMINAGLEAAKEIGFDSVIVLGHKDYYPKFGFERASKWNIKCPFDVPDEVFMGIELQEGALKDKGGTVEYSKEFMEEE